MEIDASFRVLHVLLDPFTDVACVVINGEVKLLVAAVDPPEMVEQLDEKLAVPALPRDPVQASRVEVERPGNPHLAVGPRSLQTPLSPFSHPAEAHLRVSLQFGLILEERGYFLLRHFPDTFEPFALLRALLGGILIRSDDARPSPAVLQTMERTANRLPARLRKPFAEELEGEELAAPARAQPAMIHGGVLFDELLEALVCGLSEQRPRTTRPAGVEGGAPLPIEAGCERINGGA